jgi:hypothetical protein
MSTHEMLTGALVTQQTWGATQGMLGQGIPPSEAPASMPLVAGVKSHLCVDPLPQQPASVRSAAAPTHGSNLARHDISVMVSQI